MAPIPLFIVLGVAVLGFVCHKAILGDVESPDLDFGNGRSEGLMFDLIAVRYDTINRILAFRQDVGWRKVMVNKIKDHLESLSIEYPQILDVSTGTADVALMTSKMIPKASIIGVDPSNGMLDVGRRKVSKEKLDHKIALQWADARDFSQFNENTFDAGTMAFGIRNIPERDVAMCQIYKVMKPGSLFTILEFSQPDRSTGIIGNVAKFFIDHVVPYVGGILSGQPKMYEYLRNSIQDFPPPEQFKALVEGLQCSSSGGPSFVVDEIQNLNLRTVQLYSIRSIKNARPSAAAEKATGANEEQQEYAGAV